MTSRAKLLSIASVILCIIILLLLCGPRSSSELEEEKFVEVYVRLSMARETFAGNSLMLEQEKERILKETGVSPKEIDEFVDRLSAEPEKWAQVWKKIVERLEQKRQKLK